MFQKVIIIIYAYTYYIERIQSIINVVSKSTGTQKGRGNFHQNGKNSLLAWEEEDYSLANKKLINYGIKYKVSYYRNKNVSKHTYIYIFNHIHSHIIIKVTKDGNMINMNTQIINKIYYYYTYIIM
jgi:hypothetical protein